MKSIVQLVLLSGLLLQSSVALSSYEYNHDGAHGFGPHYGVGYDASMRQPQRKPSYSMVNTLKNLASFFQHSRIVYDAANAYFRPENSSEQFRAFWKQGEQENSFVYASKVAGNVALLYQHFIRATEGLMACADHAGSCVGYVKEKVEEIMGDDEEKDSERARLVIREQFNNFVRTLDGSSVAWSNKHTVRNELVDLQKDLIAFGESDNKHKAYLKLVLKWHPRKNKNKGVQGQARHKEYFKCVMQAVKALTE